MSELCYLLFCRCRPAPPRFCELLFLTKSQACINKESLHIHTQFEHEPKICNIWAFVYLLYQCCLQSSVENLHKTFQSGYFLLLSFWLHLIPEQGQSWHSLILLALSVYRFIRPLLRPPLFFCWLILGVERVRKMPLLQRTWEKSTVFSWCFGC